MAEEEKRKLEEDYKVLMVLLDFYSKNKHLLHHTDESYDAHVNDILDEINKIRKKLGIKHEPPKNNKS